MRLAPPEPKYALANTMAAALKVNLIDKVLRGWQAVLLNINARIENSHPGAARAWRAHNLRQELIESGGHADPV